VQEEKTQEYGVSLTLSFCLEAKWQDTEKDGESTLRAQKDVS